MSKLFLPAKVAFVVLSLFTAWQGWVFMRPEPREFTAAETQAVRKVCDRTVGELVDKVPAQSVFGVAHFANDPNDAFTTAMRKALAASPEFQVVQGSVIRKFLADVSSAVKNATSLDEVVHAGRRVGIDVLVVGKTGHVRHLEKDAAAEAQVIVYDVAKGACIMKQKVSATWTPLSGEQPPTKARGLHPLLRVLLWVCVVALLPLVTPFMTRWAVEKKSNAAGFALLGAYSAIGLLAAMLLMGFRIVGTCRSFLLMGAFLACAAYNYWICERIAAGT